MSAGESDPAALPARRAACALDGVLAHIQAHLGRPLPLAGLAALAGLSVWRFATVFRQRVGVSPHRYIRVQRVRRAQALLRAGMPAATVASEVGFYDQSHFARCFKRYCSMTPGQYQAGCRGAQRAHPWPPPAAAPFTNERSFTAMSLKDFKVLTFDVVGTLIDFERGMLDYLHRAAPGAALGDEDFLAAYREARASPDSGWFPDDLVRVWHAVAAQHGLPDTAGIAGGFRDAAAGWPAFPDSVAALQRLGRRYQLVAMTNTQRWALAHFERTLGQPFADTIGCDEALCEKPDPQFFAFTRGRLSTRGFTVADNLHVAQSQHHDIGVAHRLGLATCWIERRHGQPGFGGTLAVGEITRPDYHFHTLAQLADAVDAEA
ncbi:MAG: HAD-IA family hydrolase [Betaproteobacteria bacterium]|nr:HAD-IA family hydrolase [Betaproteobacteria bacterium]